MILGTWKSDNKFERSRNGTIYCVVKCDYCGEYFDRILSKFGKNLAKEHFCSLTCRNNYVLSKKLALREKRKSICYVCGKEFYKTQNKIKYCSLECAAKKKVDTQCKKRLGMPRPLHWGKDKCPNCGGLKNKASKLCKVCKLALHVKKESIVYEKKCQHCSNLFKSNNKSVKYCSVLCRRRGVSQRNRDRKYKNRMNRVNGSILAKWSWDKKFGCLICCEKRCIEMAHINSSEVIPLCRNHHWLFDHGKLSEAENDLLNMHRIRIDYVPFKLEENSIISTS